MKIFESMPIILFIAVSMLPASAPKSSACTAFVLQNQAGTQFCEGFDWHSGEGMAVIQKKGMGKKSIIAEVQGLEPLTWVSPSDSITFSCVKFSLSLVV